MATPIGVEGVSVPLRITRGVDGDVSIYVKENDVAFPLTDYVARLRIRRSVGGAVLVEMSSDYDTVEVDADLGLIVLHFKPAEMTDAPVEGVYSLEIVDTDDKITRLLDGDFVYDYLSAAEVSTGDILTVETANSLTLEIAPFDSTAAAAIRGVAVSTTAPTLGQIIRATAANAAAWITPLFSHISGLLAYAQLPTGSGTWDAGEGNTTTISPNVNVPGAFTAGDTAIGIIDAEPDTDEDQTAAFTAAFAAYDHVWLTRAGTYTVQSVDIPPGVVFLGHPGATFKLADNHTGLLANRYIVRVNAGATFDGRGMTLDGNHQNRTGVEEWFGVKVVGDSYAVRNLNVINPSRVGVAVEGTSGDVLVEDGILENITVEDGLNDGFSWQYARNPIGRNLKATNVRYGAAIEDAVKNPDVEIHGELCQQVVHTVIHDGNSDQKFAISGLRVRATGKDCGKVWEHAAGSGVSLMPAHYDWALDLGGEGWTNTDANILKLSGISGIRGRISMRERATVGINESWAYFDSCGDVEVCPDVDIAAAARPVFTIKNSTGPFRTIGGQISTPGQEAFRLEHATAGSNVISIGTHFNLGATKDTHTIASGTWTNVYCVGCSGIASGNQLAGVTYIAPFGGGYDTGDRIFTGAIERRTNSERTRRGDVDEYNIAIADNVATAVATFTMPAQTSTSTGVIFGYNCLLQVHAYLSSNHTHTRGAWVRVTAVRNRDANTTFSAAVVDAPVSKENGSDATLTTTLDASAISFDILSGSATETQVCRVLVTMDRDATATATLASFTGDWISSTSTSGSTCGYHVPT